MAKKVKAKVKENEKKMVCAEEADDAKSLKTPMESEDEHDDKGDGDGADDHPDADKDVALIKKMIGEYVGGDGAKEMSQQEMEALHELASEAYQAHKEMGAKEEEAYGHAGQALKLAQHMSKKKEKVHEDEGEDMDGDIKDKMPPKGKDKKAPPVDSDDGDSKEAEEQEDESESEKKMESKRVKALEQKLLEAEGRVAALEAKTKKAEVAGYVDQKLKESGQPSFTTKRFREKAGEIKSKADFDSKWSMFQEGLKNAGRTLDWSAMAEKAAVDDGGGAGGKIGLDFSKCAE